MFLIYLLLSLFICDIAFSDQSYKAGIIAEPNDGVPRSIDFVNEVSGKNLDILMIPFPIVGGTRQEFVTKNQKDELIRKLSRAAEQSKAYMVTEFREKVFCSDQSEIVADILVFDRQGDIIFDFRRPLNKDSACKPTTTGIKKLTMDFGVTFAVLADEYILLRKPLELKSLKNLVILSSSENSEEFLSFWSYVAESNVLTFDGIYAGSEMKDNDDHNVIVAQLKSAGGTADGLQYTFNENLSGYVIKPLDVQASLDGYTKKVCHGLFCCTFYVKSDESSSKPLNHSVGVYSGVKSFGIHDVNIQHCAIFPCSGHEEHCILGSGTNNYFKRVTIEGIFNNNSFQYPISISSKKPTFSKTLSNDSFHVTISCSDSQLNTFGILSLDSTKEMSSSLSVTDEVYNVIFNEDMQGLFDYLWIRMSILLFIVSIYILEMI